MTGTTQGAIQGFNTMAGHEDEIMGHALEQQVYIPYNRETGKPKGLRIHGPLKINKSFDKASPALYKACVTGEVLSEVVLKFYRIDPSGTEENYFTITLEDAIIVEIKPHMLNHFKEEDARYDHMEDVSFTYERVSWRWEPDGIVSEDSAVA
jgi:type VI secretion system secreted protein Hcp